MSQDNAKPTPNLDPYSSNYLVRLTILQRLDPFVEEILIMTTAPVTLYAFNVRLSQWSRNDVEGPLFVVKRVALPRFQLIVLNQRNSDNLVENLVGEFEYEVEVPYLLYRNSAQEVNGIWFYNTHECEAVASHFSRILSAFSKVPGKPTVVSSKSEFEDPEAVNELIDNPLDPTTPSVTSSPVLRSLL